MTLKDSLAEVDDTRNGYINLSRNSAFPLDEPDESVGKEKLNTLRMGDCTRFLDLKLMKRSQRICTLNREGLL